MNRLKETDMRLKVLVKAEEVGGFSVSVPGMPGAIHREKRWRKPWRTSVRPLSSGWR
jgi:hypothetical protein